jgi:hypothetical protein
MQFPRPPQSSRHRSANIRSSAALTVSLSSGRNAPSNCLRLPSAEIPSAWTATGSSACRGSGIASTIRPIPSSSNTLAIRLRIPLRIPVTFGWIFRQQMSCLCPMQSHRESTPASTPIPNTIRRGSCTNLPTERRREADGTIPSRRSDNPVASARLCLIEGVPLERIVTLLVVRRRSEIASARCIGKGPSQGCGGAACEEAYSWGGVRGFCAGVEAMIRHSILWQCRNGASHRKNVDTPPLGGNCGETWACSRGTFLASDR